MKQYAVYFEGGLMVNAGGYKIAEDALIFYDDTGMTMRIPMEAIDTYTITEES